MKLTVSNLLSTYAYTYTYLHMPARKNTQGKSFKSAFNSLLLELWADRDSKKAESQNNKGKNFRYNEHDIPSFLKCPEQ